MAEIAASVVSLLLEKVMTILSENTNLLGGLHREATDLEDELEGMRNLLLMTNKTRADQKWLHDVREQAYDIEDCIDSYRLRIVAVSRGREGDGCIGLLNKALHFLKTLPQRCQIAKEIQVIEAKVKRLHELRLRYAKDSSTQQASSDWRNDARSAAPDVERVHLVGMEERQNELMDRLLGGNRQLTIISLVGIGGLGKTTLAWNLFMDQQVEKSFPIKAWIGVSQQSNSHVLLRCLITHVFQSGQQSLPQGLESLTELQLVNQLQCFLRNKKYMIILDDVREYGIWERIASAFPNADTGSRVMVTTQRHNVASNCSIAKRDYLTQEYPVRHLSEGQAWDLFCSRAFRANPGFVCPPYLEEVAKRIVERCAQLPLAVVTVGGLLATKPPTPDEWNRLDDSLIAELQSNNEHPNVPKILSLGYDDLPAHLKPCFLCFSAFPVIKQTRLMRIWIAEGLVGSVGNKKPEDVAMAYIKELINRCLIQVLDSFGATKFCHVHGFMREILEFKCKEESFYKLLHEQQHGKMQPTNGNDDQHGQASQDPSPGKIRRLSVRGSSSPQVYQSMASLLQQSNCSSSLRSLIIAIGAPTSIPSPSPNLTYKFRKLRVLDLEGANISWLSAGQIASCHLLKYLSLRDTNLDSLPNSLGKLFDLETLDLRGTRITRLPAGVINLHRLRHLLVPCPTSSRPIPEETGAILHVTWYIFAAQPSVKVPPGVGQLRSLVKLTMFDIGHGDGMLAELQNLTQLRKLGLRRIRREDGKELCATIAKMSCLQSLVLHSMGTDELLDLQSLSSPPELLENLFLAGPLGKLPTWAQSLHSIVKIVLMGSKLMDDLFEALQGLPNLKHLYLIGAFSGKSLGSTKGGFKELRILHLSYLNELESVTVMEGAMPTLAKMSIWYCEALKEVPSGIEHLKNLKELHLLGMPQEFDRMLGRDRGKLKHISLIRSSTLINSKDGNWSKWIDEDISCNIQVEMEEEETEEEDVEAITPAR